MEALIEALWSSDASEGYAALKELLVASKVSDEVYQHLDLLIERLDSDSSYFRTRALALIVANAKWDARGAIDKNIDRILAHVVDNRPVTARKLIADLPRLASWKPLLRERIISELRNADTSRYSPSMRPLVDKDIWAAIEELEAQDE